MTVLSVTSASEATILSFFTYNHSKFSLFVYLYFYYKEMEGRNQLFTEGKKEKRQPLDFNDCLLLCGGFTL